MNDYKEMYFEVSDESQIKIAKSLVAKGALEEVVVDGQVKYRFTDEGFNFAHNQFSKN